MNGNNYSKYIFADRLKNRRIACEISSCEKLAKLIFPDGNVDSMRKKVERWEKGLCEPTVSEFYKLCDTLDCDPEYLWGVIDVPHKTTLTVMEITRLSHEAVDMLVEFNHIISDTSCQFLQPSYVISLFLNNPSFYSIIGEINSSTYRQMILEKAKIEKAMVNPIQKEAYEAELTELEDMTAKIGNLVNDYGYEIVQISELLKISEFKISQSLGTVVQETVNTLHNDAKEYIHQLFEESAKTS